MIDYHVHLWPHPQLADETDLAVERLAEYCELARAAGVTEIALTEHYHRFTKGREIVEGWWAREPNEELRAYMAHYFDHHATVDLDRYVETVIAAKQAGLPIVAGLEVDYYPGLMDKVGTLLDGYPFDVLLGSIHWLGTWMFDIVGSPAQMAEWDVRGTNGTWRAYGEAIEELAGTATCDVLAHPDLVKVTGRMADAGIVDEVEERILRGSRVEWDGCRALVGGFPQACGGCLPVAQPAGALLQQRGADHDGFRHPWADARRRPLGGAAHPGHAGGLLQPASLSETGRARCPAR